jgi:ribosome-binding factor A
MSRQRMVRVNELLKREVASALYRVINEAGFDLTAVTVTGVEVGSDLRTARVRVSIRDHRDERQKMLNLLRRRRGDIQELLHRNVILKYTPKLSFELDESIEQGDRILQILYKMENSGELEPGGGKGPTP